MWLRLRLRRWMRTRTAGKSPCGVPRRMTHSTVAAVGEEVEGWAVGDRVMAMVGTRQTMDATIAQSSNATMDEAAAVLGMAERVREMNGAVLR